MSKYIFQDGGDATGEETFNSYIDQLMASQQQQQQEQQPTDELVDEETAYIKGLRTYDEDNEDNQVISELTSRLDGMQSILDQQLQMRGMQQQEMDWYGDDASEDELTNMYDTKNLSNRGGVFTIGTPTNTKAVMANGNFNNLPSNLKGNTAAARNNNPGNIKFASWMKEYGATVGSKALDGGNFAKFPNVESALNARKYLLTRPLYANKTVNEGLKMYSGSGYDGGIYPEIRNKKMSDLTEAEKNELLKRQLKSEDVNVARQLGIS